MRKPIRKKIRLEQLETMLLKIERRMQRLSLEAFNVRQAIEYVNKSDIGTKKAEINEVMESAVVAVQELEAQTIPQGEQNAVS